MYNQLLNLYTIDEHIKHQQHGHISLYITPNGEVFDCRQNGVLSHCAFANEFYSNYHKLMQIHKNIDFNTEVSEFILGYDSFGLKDVVEFYLEQFDYVQYHNLKLYTLVKLDCLAVDNILVQDLGFVKVSINRGELPKIDLPIPIFNGKKFTPMQYNSLLKILDNNTISNQDFNAKQLIKIRERDLKIINLELERLRNENLNIL